jgi:hypothetical protein
LPDFIAIPVKNKQCKKVSIPLFLNLTYMYSMKMNDNKTAREEATKNLLAALLKINIETIRPLHKTMLVEVLLNGRTFSELTEIVNLTTARQRTVFQNAVNRLINALRGMNEKLNSCDELKEELLLTQKRLQILESKINKELSISPELKKAWSVPIGEAGFSNRVRQICSMADIHFISDLVSLSKREFLQLRNCGKKCMNEVDAYLDMNGLSWKMPI